jgi:hypothetical protein
MKKIFVTMMILATMAIMLPIAAEAQTSTMRRVYRNGRWQTVRVYTPVRRAYGVRRQSRLTPQEQRRLARQRTRLYRQSDRITRDGVVTRQEYRRINRSTNKYNRKVRRARNN